MTTKVFYSTVKNSYVNRTEKRFKDHNVEHIMHDISENTIPWKDFLTIIELADDGIESLITHKPKPELKEIISSIDFDAIKLNEFYNVVAEHPNILRNPIVLKGNCMMVGFNKDDLSQFDSKKDKKARFSELLESVRIRERYELEQELGYSLS